MPSLPRQDIRKVIKMAQRGLYGQNNTILGRQVRLMLLSTIGVALLIFVVYKFQQGSKNLLATSFLLIIGEVGAVLFIWGVVRTVKYIIEIWK